MPSCPLGPGEETAAASTVGSRQTSPEQAAVLSARPPARESPRARSLRSSSWGRGSRRGRGGVISDIEQVFLGLSAVTLCLLKYLPMVFGLFSYSFENSLYIRVEVFNQRGDLQMFSPSLSLFKHLEPPSGSARECGDFISGRGMDRVSWRCSSRGQGSRHTSTRRESERSCGSFLVISPQTETRPRKRLSPDSPAVNKRLRCDCRRDCGSFHWSPGSHSCLFGAACGSHVAGTLETLVPPMN